MSVPGPGCLLVVAAPPVGEEPSGRAIESLGAAAHLWGEDTPPVAGLLAAAGVPADRCSPLAGADPADVVRRVAGGATVAVVVAGPAGAPLVGAVVDAGLPVEVVPAPTPTVTALVASGLATDHVAVEAALPTAGPAREARLAALATERRTTALPVPTSDLAVTLADIATACGPERPVAVVAGGTTWRGSASAAAAAPEGDDPVVVVAGAPGAEDEAPASDEAVREALRQARDRGLSPGRAAAEVAAALGRPRREVYALGAEEDRT
ncbi:MAG TPA: hypothetical protein VFU19_11215 [Iamia sp.]|nr:hypothetical protein [Iamia sp.]